MAILGQFGLKFAVIYILTSVQKFPKNLVSTEFPVFGR